MICSLRAGWVCGAVLALAASGGLAAAGQAPAQPANAPAQQKPAPKPPADSNPFPEDTTSVPVLPSNNAAAVPDAPVENAAPVLPADDEDPVRSPDEPLPVEQGSSDSSSSLSNLESLLPGGSADADTKGSGRRRLTPPASEHQETAKEDESVGSYYLSTHNWKAAQSRFESALVLDPENPDVYWGLAEAQRHLGDLANAKANYQKLLDYDPDGKHARDVKKLLKDPEMANVAAKK